MSTLESKRAKFNYYRVLLFREQPSLAFSGLTREIGTPREYEKNLEDPSYFDKKTDITVLQEETNELHEYFMKQNVQDRDVVSDQKTALSNSNSTRKNTNDKNECINSAGSQGDANQFDDNLMTKHNLAVKIPDSRGTCTPIKSLNTFLFDWKIKARVTKKHQKKAWKN